jgi:hypothetical protein
MEWFDPVVEEVRERGRKYFERLGNDTHAVMEDMRKHQREHPERYVSLEEVMKRKNAK